MSFLSKWIGGTAAPFKAVQVLSKEAAPAERSGRMNLTGNV
jgi:hypothetical protein